MRALYIHDKYMSCISHKQFWEGFMRIVVVTSGGLDWELSCVWRRLIHFSLHAFFFLVRILFLLKK